MNPHLVLLFALALACNDAAENTPPEGGDVDTDPGGSDSGDTDTPADQGCPQVEAPTWPDCVVAVRAYPVVGGTHYDAHRTTYDGDANPVAYSFVGWEDPAEDWLDCTWTWAGPSQVAQEQCTGRATYTYTWHYEDGVLVGKDYDQASDGELDRSWTYQTDAAGHVVHEDLDEDLDGETDATVDHIWDGDQLQESRWDYQADGADDYSITWLYNPTGAVLEQVIDSDGNGTPDEVQSWVYDAVDNPLSSELDLGADGAWDEQQEWRYDTERCRLDRVDTLEYSGARQGLRYWYDENTGELHKLLWDHNGDDETDAVDRYSYECSG